MAEGEFNNKTSLRLRSLESLPCNVEKHVGGLVVECSLTVRQVMGSIPGRLIPKDCKS